MPGFYLYANPEEWLSVVKIYASQSAKIFSSHQMTTNKPHATKVYLFIYLFIIKLHKGRLTTYNASRANKINVML